MRTLASKSQRHVKMSPRNSGTGVLDTESNIFMSRLAQISEILIG